MRDLILVHFLALAGTILNLFYGGSYREVGWNVLFFTYNWWGTHFMAKWIIKRMKKNNKRALFEIYFNPLGWKLLLNFRNAERLIIERGSHFTTQGVQPCLDPPTEANSGY